MNANPHNCKVRSHSRRMRAGLTLLEVMLALALFATAAVALVQAINSIAQATIEARNLRTVEQTLEGIIDEESKKPQIVEIPRKDLTAGPDGIAYHIRVAQEQDLRNKAGNPLNALYRVTVTAEWKEDSRPMKLEVSTLRYAGMFLPGQ